MIFILTCLSSSIVPPITTFVKDSNLNAVTNLNGQLAIINVSVVLTSINGTSVMTTSSPWNEPNR